MTQPLSSTTPLRLKSGDAERCHVSSRRSNHVKRPLTLLAIVQTGSELRVRIEVQAGTSAQVDDQATHAPNSATLAQVLAADDAQLAPPNGDSRTAFTNVEAADDDKPY